MSVLHCLRKAVQTADCCCLCCLTQCFVSPPQRCLALGFRTSCWENVCRRRVGEFRWLDAPPTRPHRNGSGFQRAQLWAINSQGSAWPHQGNSMKESTSGPASLMLELSIWTGRQRARHGHVPRKATSLWWGVGYTLVLHRNPLWSSSLGSTSRYKYIIKGTALAIIIFT